MYISIAELEKALGITVETADEDFVNSQIQACQNYIENYCGDEKFGKRIFEAPDPDTAVIKRFDGNGTKRLYVGDLFDIVSITIDDEEYVIDEDIFAYPLNNTDIAYEYLELVQPETRLSSNSRAGFGDYVFEIAQANIEIEGHWYYTEVPPDEIKIAMYKLMSALLKEKPSSTIREKKSEKLGDYSVEYTDIGKLAYSLGVDSILNQHKRKSSPKGNAGVIQVS